MTCQLQAQPLIPYNVLAGVPTSNTGSPIGNADSQADWQKTIEDLKKAWEAFQKTGNLQLVALKQGFSAATGGEFNYLALLQAGIGLVGTLGAGIPGVAVAAPILSMVVGWLWPNKATDDSAKLIALIDQEIQKQLNKALSEQDKNNWQGYLESIQDISNRATKAIMNAQFTGTEGDTNRQHRTPGTSDYQNVHDRLIGTHDSLILALGQMINGNFDTLAIPFFVIGATIHLSTYQSYIKFAEQWLPVVYPDYQTPGTSGYTQYQELIDAKSELRGYIYNHTNKVFDAFKAGAPSLDSNKRSINEYNKYVRGMALNALDIVATWPTLYPDDYSTQTKVEQTRVLFSDLVGKDQRVNRDVTLINMQDKPNANNWNQHLSIDINSISYFPDELLKVQFSIHDGSRGGVANCYPYAIISDYAKGSYFYGDLYSPAPGGNPNYSAPLYLINSRTQYSQYVDSESVIMSSNPSGAGYEINCHILGYCSTGDCYSQSNCSSGYGESCNTPLPSQKINALYPFKMDLGRGGTKDKIGLMSAHVPYDLSPNNTIGDKDPVTQEIVTKGIPAEKGYASTPGQTVQTVREHLNAAQAVKLAPGQSWGMDFTNGTGGSYMVRCRYASSNNTPIFFNLVYDGGSNPIFEHMTFPTTENNKPNTYSKIVGVKGTNGTYSLMTVKDSIQLPSGKFHVFFTNNGSSAIYLDRLEFVPITVENCVSLFTNGSFSIDNGRKTIWTSNVQKAHSIQDISGTVGMRNFNWSIEFSRDGKTLPQYTINVPGQPFDHYSFGPYNETIPEGFDTIQMVCNFPIVISPASGKVCF
ncbi:hypothetical protein BM86_17155 [Bacillus thuringiensis]|uniref:Crystaline entomocidal protoxin n=1 Tax=Bacillus thuringiensis TaxID=1428 RepID=A0A9W3SAF1_BACTU|nr:insecticidal delta-endotoxin Cry8Ea1 family protein [Bacillus thuringiensis]ANS46780.1 pesticidal crystal protein Cry13Ba1 [Bacillus thuringiensis]MBH0337154.1 hypothetical protein [Bacillus thuringiensis]